MVAYHFYINRFFLSMALFVLLSLGSSTFAATKIGFNYYPEGYWSEFLHDKNWVEKDVKEQVAADLEHLSSLGVEVVRLMLFSFDGSVSFTDTGMKFNPEYTEQKKNLIEFLALCEGYGIQVILASENWHSKDEWQPFYSHLGFIDEQRYLKDSLTWTSGLFHAALYSQYADSVYFYDLQNESAVYIDEAWGGYRVHGKLIATLYDGLNIPFDKLGLSILFAQTEQLLVLQQAIEHDGVQRRNFAYMDFHIYASNNQFDANWHRSLIQDIYPLATWVIGETGFQGDQYSPESQQVNWAFGEEGVYTQAMRYDFPLITWWLLWDYPDDGASVKQTFGLAYDRHTPKEVMGGFARYMDRLSNQEGDQRFSGVIKDPDMEIADGDRLVHWTLGSTLPQAFLVPGNGVSEKIALGQSASGMKHALIKVNATQQQTIQQKVQFTEPHTVWVEAEPIEVGDKKQIFSNFYFRVRGLSQVRLVAVPYNEQGAKLDIVAGSWVAVDGENVLDGSESWYNYLALAGAQNLHVPDGTAKVVLRAEALLTMPHEASLEVDIFTGNTR